MLIVLIAVGLVIIAVDVCLVIMCSKEDMEHEDMEQLEAISQYILIKKQRKQSYGK